MDSYQDLQLPPGVMQGLMSTGFTPGPQPLLPDDKSRMLTQLGLSLMQPVQPGMTPIGAAAGRTSAVMDQAAQLAERRKAETLAQMQIAASLMKTGSGIRGETANTQITEAKVPYAGRVAGAEARGAEAGARRQEAGATVDEATMQPHIDQARAQADEAVIKAHRAGASATKVEELDAIEADLKLKKANIEKTVPDKTIRASILAEYEKAAATIAKLRAEANSDNSRAGLYSAEHKLKSKELEGLNGASEDEIKSYFSKSGKFSGTVSAMDRQAQLWGSLYDKLPADDPAKKGKTREQFQLGQLQQAKRKDAVEILVKAKQAGFTDEEIADLGLLDMAKEAAAERRPTAPRSASPTAGATGNGWGITKKGP